MEMTMEKFVAYLKQLGFVYQGSEIYGGLANTWDYGPLGVELLNNVKKLISEYKSLVSEYRNAENVSTKMKGTDFESGLGIAKNDDNVLEVEKKLMKKVELNNSRNLTLYIS